MTAEQKAAVDEAERLHGLATPGPWERTDRGNLVGPQSKNFPHENPTMNRLHVASEIDDIDGLYVAALHNIAGVLFAAYRENERANAALPDIKTMLSAKRLADREAKANSRGTLTPEWEAARVAAALIKLVAASRPRSVRCRPIALWAEYGCAS